MYNKLIIISNGRTLVSWSIGEKLGTINTQVTVITQTSRCTSDFFQNALSAIERQTLYAGYIPLIYTTGHTANSADCTFLEKLQIPHHFAEREQLHSFFLKLSRPSDRIGTSLFTSIRLSTRRWLPAKEDLPVMRPELRSRNFHFTRLGCYCWGRGLLSESSWLTTYWKEGMGDYWFGLWWFRDGGYSTLW